MAVFNIEKVQNSSLIVQRDSSVQGMLIAVDKENDPLTYTILREPESGTAVLDDLGSGTFTYTPDPGFIGSDSFTFKVNDGLSDSNPANVFITVQQPEEYTVIFKDHDGIVLKEEQIEHGNSATAPDDPTRDGYTFTGWDKAFATISANLTVTARYDKLTYKVTYTAGDNGTIIGPTQQTVKHGENSEEVTAQPETGYEFVQWSDGVSANLRIDENVTEDIHVTATFQEKIAPPDLEVTVDYEDNKNKISIINLYLNPCELKPIGVFTVPEREEWVEFKASASQGDVVLLIGEGYLPETKGALGCPEYTQAFDASGQFDWFDGTKIFTHSLQSQPGEKIYLSAFSHFGISNYEIISEIAKVQIFTAVYLSGDNGSIDGNPLQSIKHGQDGTEVTAVPDAGYYFVSWDDGTTTNPRTDRDVKQNINVSANFQIIRYSVVFKDHDGAILKMDTVSHGEGAIPPEDPTRKGYTFTGWDKAFDNITGDLTVTANFERNQYTVTFKDHDGTELKSETVVHGSGATAPPKPEREGYAFKGWDKAFATISADLLVTARYERLTYQVTYTAGENGTITGLTPQTVLHGNSSEAVTAEPETGYHFVEWSDGLETNPRTDENVTSDILVSAVFDYIKGDVNLDGKVNMKDAILLIQYAAGRDDLTDAQKKRGNISGHPDDNQVGMADAIRIFGIMAQSHSLEKQEN
jgi:uncharacterized repeat protein (TIGR02543 family)